MTSEGRDPARARDTASAAAAMGVPVRLVKHVADDSDEQATRSWSDSVEASAAMLNGWLANNLAG